MEPLTIRLESERTLLSNDSGDTWSLDAHDALLVQKLCEQVLDDMSPSVGGGGLTAALRASIREAANVRPRNSGRAPSDPAPVPVPVPAPAPAPAVPLGNVAHADSRSLKDILDIRQSERYIKPAGLSELATVLVRAGRARGWRDTGDGEQHETRTLPSAGGCHPIEIHVLTTGIGGLDSGWWAFDPLRCELHFLDDALDQVREVWRNFEDRGFRLEHGYTVIFTMAHFERTLKRYPAGGSLVWRDAGVVLGALHLCAVDAGLASCIVATCGLLGSTESQPIDVGAVVVGQRTTSSPLS
jgi:SagB-type dehydrogenase family enzyme